MRDRLVNHFGSDSVYMDIDSVPFGVDFREHIKEALLQNDVLVAVIGPNWLGQTNNNNRIFDETDAVRIEIETALQNRIPVVPVLVAGATMPRVAELPDSIKDLAFRNAATVDGGRDFHPHMERLIRSMGQLLADKQKESVRKASPNLGSPPVAQKQKQESVLASLFVSGIIIAMLIGFVYFIYAPSQQMHSEPPQQMHSEPQLPGRLPSWR
jgi:hypothetical protein